MNASEFRLEVVDPLLAEAERDPLVFRRVFSLIAAIDSWAAQIYQDKRAAGEVFDWSALPREIKQPDDSTFRELLAKRSSDFELLRDVAKALKHVSLDRHNPRVKSAEQVEVQNLGYGQGGFGEGPFGGGQQFVITDNDQKRRNAISVCKRSIEFLQSQI